MEEKKWGKMKKEDQCTWRDCEFITPRTKKTSEQLQLLALLRVERTTATGTGGKSEEGSMMMPSASEMERKTTTNAKESPFIPPNHTSERRFDG